MPRTACRHADVASQIDGGILPGRLIEGTSVYISIVAVTISGIIISNRRCNFTLIKNA